ncbi:MAG: ring-cleaving dioxygenase [Pseudomonadota bacterium]
MPQIPGLHHVTAICDSPQANYDFFTGPLAQRFVKKTVNFDDPGTYHLYYGNRAAAPGSIMTYFPFVGAGPGRPGAGMATAVAYALPAGALNGAMERLAEAGTDFVGPFERFGAPAITVRDPDGLAVDLIETAGAGDPLGTFHSVTLRVADVGPTAKLLTDIFGYSQTGEEAPTDDHTAPRLRFTAEGAGPGGIVDIERSGAPGRPGVGTIHHIAFRARPPDEQHHWRETLLTAGFQVTPVIDRQYFHAIYFREPGGILFEIATDPPGFATDEPADRLGEALMLPGQYEGMRAKIEAGLPPLKTR